MRFDDFMRDALYHPERGYYRPQRGGHSKTRDPFGIHGDFFTASQLQPLFGRIIAAEARSLCPGQPVFELGPGRREMQPFFETAYTGIDFADALPDRLNGFVFANEFFDALPVRMGAREGKLLYELLVQGEKFLRGPVLDEASTAYVHRYWPHVPDGGRFEIAAEACDWIDRLAARMESGCVLIIDYGFTTEETIRFPQGTLMSYRDHAAIESVLSNPGGQDITAHVPFDALRDRAVARGFRVQALETLARLTVKRIELDPTLIGAPRDREHLKTLMFGMGETFRCLLLKMEAPKKNGPDRSGPSSEA
jgi:SAM-dependent MidA family methyltransferase